MSGEEFKKILSEHGYNPASVYTLLEMSSQAFNQATKAQDIKTGFLERVCHCTGETIDIFYPDLMPPVNKVVQNFARQNAHNIANGSGDINEDSGSAETIKELVRTIADLRRDKQNLERDKEDLRQIIDILRMQLYRHNKQQP